MAVKKTTTKAAAKTVASATTGHSCCEVGSRYTKLMLLLSLAGVVAFVLLGFKFFRFTDSAILSALFNIGVTSFSVAAIILVGRYSSNYASAVFSTMPKGGKNITELKKICGYKESNSAWKTIFTIKITNILFLVGFIVFVLFSLNGMHNYIEKKAECRNKAQCSKSYSAKKNCKKCHKGKAKAAYHKAR